jgi:hypothetical protein
MMISSLAQSPRINSVNNSIKSKNTPTAFKGFLVLSHYYTNNRLLKRAAIDAIMGDKVEVRHCIKGSDKHFRRLAKALFAEDEAAKPSVKLEGPFRPEVKALLIGIAAKSKILKKSRDRKEIKVREDFLRRNIFTVLEKTSEGILFSSKRIIGVNPDNTTKFKQSNTKFSRQDKFCVEWTIEDNRKLKIRQVIMHVPDEEIAKIKKTDDLRAKFDEFWFAK